MKTRCLKCRKKIDKGESYCSECLSANRKEYKNQNKKDIKNEKAEKSLGTALWKTVRRQVLVRDNGCCQLCLTRGYIENRKLQVHHLVKRIDNEYLTYTPSNLVTVCPPCHEELEKLPVKQQMLLLKKDFIPEEEEYMLL